MSILFGFAGRIGRLNYFLMCLAVGLVTAMLVGLIIGFMAPHYPDLSARHIPLAIILTIVLVVGPFVMWFSLALQAKRFRDMGWPPVQSIVGLWALNILDKLVAMLIPAVAIGPGSGTVLGLAINLFVWGSLLFWPSESSVDANIYRVFLDMESHGRQPAAKPNRPAPSTAAAEPATNPIAVPRPAGFGRRGL